MRTPPLLADFIQTSVCKLICEKLLTLPSKEDYDDFFRATGYIENTQETGSVTSILPVCDSDKCCKNDMVLAIPFRIPKGQALR